jgi:MOSC domain-containing protein YiiM
LKIFGLALGGIETLSYRGKSVRTGIFKTPVEGPIWLGKTGVADDVQVDLKNHGGVDKAVYAYSLENLRHWSSLRGEPAYAAGHLGENLTLEDLDDHAVHLGDQFQIGETLLEVTQPRVPCFKLGIRMNDMRFVETFLRSGRTGFYLRVLQEGWVYRGDSVIGLHQDPHQVSIPDAMKALLKGPEQKHWIQRALEVPALSAAWREDLETRLHSTDS